MPNPNIPQGVLNRLKASVIWNDFPGLNVTASFLGRDGIRFALEGESTVFLNTMTGAVTSPEPYMLCNLTINLLKTQALAEQYKAKMTDNAVLGDGTVRPDLSAGNGITPFSIVNCAIESIREMPMDGTDPVMAVAIKGYYLVNNNLWS